MKMRGSFLPAVLLFAAWCSMADYPAPNALAAAPDGLWVAEEHTALLRRLDPETLEPAGAAIELEQPPTGLVSSAGRLYVTAGLTTGELLEVDPERRQILRRLAIGHSPQSPAISADGRTLYFANRFSGQVGAVELKEFSLRWRSPAGREPVAVVPDAANRKVYAANHLPIGPANGTTHQAAVFVLDAADGAVLKHIPLANGAQGIRGAALSPDGAWLIVTHVVSHYKLPTTQIDRGWINTNAISLIRTGDDRRLATVLLDDVNRGAANPWAAAFSADGAQLLVSAAGSHELFLIDFPGLLAKLAETPAENQLSYLNKLRTRLPLPVNGPRALTIAGNRAFVAGYYSDNIALISLGSRPRVLASRELPGADAGDPRRLGEKYFNDARLCRENWQSCASCHPDARVDALNWDMLNDGIGNPKNTKTMFLSHRTPPVMSLGIRPDAETAVRAGFRHIEFNEPVEEYCQAIDLYLAQMPPVPSPFLNSEEITGIASDDPGCLQCHTPDRGGLSAAAQRGKAIFAGKGGCIACHPHPLFTNLELYDVGTTTGSDIGRPVRTPSLVEVWRTAPYLHDGRAATLEEAVTKYNPGDRRGTTSGLTPEEVRDLVSYLESL